MTGAFAASGPDQRFADALCGSDGTGDPAVLMPVLDVYPDALSAPMPDAMVAIPPIDPSAMVAAARAGLGAPALTPAQARVAAERAMPPRRPGSPSPTTPRPPPAARRPNPPAMRPVPGTPPPSPWAAAGYTLAHPTEFLRSTFAGLAPGGAADTAATRSAPVSRVAPPTPARPPTPRRTRRNKGSSTWAVLIFLVVLAFASGLAQQFFRLISELFNQ